MLLNKKKPLQSQKVLNGTVKNWKGQRLVVVYTIMLENQELIALICKL